jgi:phage FluMu protein gp41
MALGDFFARLTGRKAEPEPAPIPRAPTNDDLLAALVRVEQLVADGAVPAVVASRVNRVVRIVRETIPRLGNLGGSMQAYNVMATATDYLPEAIGGYLRLPRQWADSRPVDRGKTSLMILIDQLDLLGATMDKVFDAVNRADAAALIAHGRFLQEKFGTGSTGGSLALGETPSTPAPDSPPGAGPLQPPPGRGGA